jgi:transcriptional regulator with XRE-family HTH domain
MEQRADAWPRRLSATIAAEVRKHRLAQGMSTQQLSDKCASLGLEIPRPVLSNLENGRRENVAIAEILVLSAALEITPIALIFPVGYTSKTEPLPGVLAHPLDAVFWFSGEADCLMGYRSGRVDQGPDVSQTGRAEVVNAREGGVVWAEGSDAGQQGANPMNMARILAETAAAIEVQQEKGRLIRNAAGQMASDDIAGRTAELADQVAQNAEEYARYLDRYRRREEARFPDLDLSYPSPSARTVRPLNFGTARGAFTSPTPDVIFEDET